MFSKTDVLTWRGKSPVGFIVVTDEKVYELLKKGLGIRFSTQQLKKDGKVLEETVLSCDLMPVRIMHVDEGDG